MALTAGVNCGFVTVAPTDDPLGAVTPLRSYAVGFRVVTPAAIAGITAFGWWCDAAASDATINYEVGLYADNAAISIPGSRLFVNPTNAMQTAPGWKQVATDWAITSGTTYWIALQLDDLPTGGATNYAWASATNYARARISAQTTLLDPFNTGAVYTPEILLGFYVIGVAGGGTTHNLTGSISAISYLSEVGWSVTRYVSGSISGVGNLVSPTMGLTHYLVGSVLAIGYITADLTKQATNINIVSNITAAPYHTRDGSDGLLVKGGVEAQGGFYTDSGVGQTITFTAQDGRTVTVNKGIIIAIS